MPWAEVSPARFADPRPSPEHQFLDLESGRRAQAAVSELRERDRQCLELRAEGLRYRDISTTLGISLGAVAKSVARALAHLSAAARG